MKAFRLNEFTFDDNKYIQGYTVNIESLISEIIAFVWRIPRLRDEKSDI